MQRFVCKNLKSVWPVSEFSYKSSYILNFLARVLKILIILFPASFFVKLTDICRVGSLVWQIFCDSVDGR